MRVSTAILLAFHFRWCVAETQCAHAPGSCGKQQSSLMQLKTLGVRRAQAQIQHDSFSSTGSRLVAYQKFADDMIAMDADNRLDISQDTLDAVTVIHDFIEGLFTILNGSHTEDLRVVQRCRTIATTCETQTLTGNTWEAQGAIVSLKSNKHKICRDDRETTCRAQHSSCHNYNAYRQDPHGAPDESVQFLPACATTDFAEEFMQADAHTQALQTMESCLDKMYRWLHLGFKETPETKNGLWPFYQQCRRNQCKPLKTACENNQTDYEGAVCGFARDKLLKCNNYFHCISCNKEDCGTKCEQISQNWQGRLADNETAQRLTCLLDVLFGKQDPQNLTGTGYFPRASDTKRPELLTKCKEDDYTEHYWTLECNISATPERCVVPNSPCSPDFLEEYTSDPNNFKLPCASEEAACEKETYVEEGIARRVEDCHPCDPTITPVNPTPTC